MRPTGIGRPLPRQFIPRSQVDIFFVSQGKNVVVCVRGGKTVISSAVRKTPPTSSTDLVDNTIVNVVISGALFVKVACINKHTYVI
jgi:hypothetical protein